MFAAVIAVHVVCSLALILIVLLQAGKGTGISNVFGGAGQTVFGARTGDMLTKGTAVCAALFMTTSLVLAMMSSNRSSSVMHKRPVMEGSILPVGVDQQIPMPAATPAQAAAMNKIKQAMAGVAETVKQAATTAPADKPAQTNASGVTPPKADK